MQRDAGEPGYADVGEEDGVRQFVVRGRVSYVDTVRGQSCPDVA